MALPAHDGEIGFLRDRAPIVCKLDAGSLRINAAGELQVLYVDGGFAEMVDNRLTILTEVARFVDELDRDEARPEYGPRWWVIAALCRGAHE